FFFFQAEDGIRDRNVTGVQTCALPISTNGRPPTAVPGSRRPLQHRRRAPRAGHPRRFRARGARYNGVRYGDVDERGPSGPDGRRSEERRVGKEGREGGARCEEERTMEK